MKNYLLMNVPLKSKRDKKSIFNNLVLYLYKTFLRKSALLLERQTVLVQIYLKDFLKRI